MGAHTKVGLVAAAVATALTLTAAPAHASFPGQNGRIAFHTNRDGNFEIYSMTATGGSPTRLTNNAADDVTPAWSPDGARLVWVSLRDGNYEIYRMNADGSGQIRMTTNSASDVAPSWSADGTKIVFATNRDGNYEIYTMDSTTGAGLTRLTNNSVLDSQPAWSPQDDKIAFTTNREGPLQVYAMSTTGTGQARYAFSQFTTSSDPNWAPDGDDLALTARHQADSAALGDEVFLQLGTGGSARQGTGNSTEADPAPSPDNAGLAFHSNNDGDYEIYKYTPFAQITTNSIADQSPDWQPVTTNYARPRGATPVQLALVPAFRQCSNLSTTNARHKGALARGSCNPAIPTSNYLTFGSPDFNGEVANAAGLIQMRAFCNGGASGETPPCLTTPGDQLDGQITVTQTDVRCIGTSGSCPNGALSDYFGNLLLSLNARITDRNSGGLGGATVYDLPVSTTFSCTPTGSNTVGSTCSATTSFDGLFGGASVITEQKRAVWELRDIEIYDGGADGVASTQGDNTLFEVGGLFFP